MVGSGLETCRDCGRVFFEGVSEEGGMFSALAMASEGLGVSVGGREV